MYKIHFMIWDFEYFKKKNLNLGLGRLDDIGWLSWSELTNL